MEGDVVTDANETFGQFSSTAEVSMEMNVTKGLNSGKD